MSASGLIFVLGVGVAAAIGGGPEIVAQPATPFRWVVLAGVWLVYATFGMATVSLAPLVVPIVRDLEVSHGVLGLVFSAWQAVFILAAVPLGALVDRIGARRGLLLGVAFIAGSGLLRSMAPDILTLWVAVAVFGLGGPIVSIGAPKLISGWFTGQERAVAMGIYITGPALGQVTVLASTNAVMMPAFGGDWRAILQLWAGLSIIAGAVWWVIATRPPMLRADQVRATGGARRTQWQALAELLRVPAVRVLLLMAVGSFTFNHALHNWLPEILRTRGMSPAVAGYWATVPTMVGILGALTLPRLATPERRYLLLCGLTLSAAIASVMLRADAGPLLFIGLVMQGIARSSLTTLMLFTLVETPGIGEARAGTASGLYFSAGELGGATGPVLLGLLHDWTGGFGAGLAVLTLIAVGLLAGAVRLMALASGDTEAAARAALRG